MNKFIKRLVVLSVMFLGLCSSIYACPAGMVELPGGVCLPPDHQNSPLNNLPSASPPPPVWADRWGAIATDGKGAFGIVRDMLSKRKAEKAAIQECTKRGGKGCFTEYFYNNQCVAVGSNDKTYHYARFPTEDEAKTIAVQKCQERSGEACVVFYSGCSMPVRVN
ncbi:DUF4189 domain-containing protein [Acinetobacter courvalinii]|uniref:DUF4189 domain-containing protein n=1 Tax=Acinetobacter courvalinii TaxID=280147 RepID=UPI0028A24F8D|nr:DUF4189 domain-containing protein [Acinetobacter courvalinii]